MANPTDGQLRVVACSPFPDTGGETILYPKCEIDGVIVANGVMPVAVRFNGYGVPKPKWPRPGIMLPITFDRADAARFSIRWQEVPTGREAAEQLAAQLSAGPLGEPRIGDQASAHRPNVWHEATYVSAYPLVNNGLTPAETELALSGQGAAIGLIPVVSKVLSARPTGPRSAPGGTWGITVWVEGMDGGSGWQAVTRMSFSSVQRREQRTVPGEELPLLIDPANRQRQRQRVIVDLSRLS
ncbi:hypothetical protein [Paraburkholderia tropica]|uniref:hypothetical protein n=1 Tax=Paraburkholderia tropica TaxID=92647 RepID=UPI002AB721AA|nr:hypothetical protein [Paraburkholderia tropica]